MGEELLQQPEKTEQPQDAGNGVPQNQNSASLTQEQREADKRLLDIIDKRLDAMSAVQTRANAYMVALCLLIIIQIATLIGFGVWTGFTQRAVKPRPSGRGYKAHLNWNFCL